jgi:probable HAF family extracellular repeat protein
MLALIHSRIKRRNVIPASIVLALTASLTTPAPATAVPSGFVSRQGTELTLDGNPYRFAGLNIFNANSDGWCGAQMNQGPALDDALTAIGPGVEVIRSWFFQPLAIDKGTRLRDWSAFDHTLQVAAAHGKKVIVTLTDQWGECGTDVAGNGYKEADWYVTGYQQVQPGMLVSYRDWVAEVVDRYKNDPRIAFWQLINEAEVTPCPPGDLQPFQTLRDWATDVSGLVKSIDPDHLVSLGTIGSGQCGADGLRYQDLHAIPTIDLCEYHDYGAPNVGMPGDQFNGLQVRIDQCNALNKPIFVGEAGIIPNDVGGTFQARADAFDVKLDAQLAAGVSGFLAWAWSPQVTPVSTLDNYDIGPGDPALAVLEHAVGPTAPGALDLGTLGGTSSVAVDVNDSGQVVGHSLIAGDVAQHAFSWTPAGGMVDLGTLGGDLANATAVSDDGVVIGVSSDASNREHAFYWTQSEGMVDLGTLGGPTSFAAALNDSGQIVGRALTQGPSSQEHAFSWTQAGGMIDLGTLGGIGSEAFAINEGGQVVGRSVVTGSFNQRHAFSWTQAGGMVDLGTLGGSESDARAINAAGQAVGTATTTGDSESRPFSWTQAEGMVDLGSLGGRHGIAVAVNDIGQVVGQADIAPGSADAHPFSWTQAGGLVDLGTLGGRNGSARDVNDSGRVAGASFLSGEAVRHAFSWTEAGGMVDLGTLGGPESFAFALNASGQVVGVSDTASHQSHATLWEPPNAPPDDPVILGQFEANGTSPIAVGATTDGTTVVMKATATDPDGDPVRLQVEVEPVGTPFDGAGFITGAPVPSGSTASASVGGLGRAKGYHWQARTLDALEEPSQDWVSFGTNAESAADFVVEAPIVFASTRHASNTPTQQEIYSMAPDGSGATRLMVNTTIDADPSLSPDATRIAFQSNRDGDYEIFVMDIDGTDVVKLTANSSRDEAPAWSPDGTKLAFMSNRITQSNADIWVMNADGTNPVRLTTVASTDTYPSWSPDGEMIAFTSSRDGDEEIFVMNADGSNQTQITINKRRDFIPAWSPNGARIAFASNRDVSNNLDIYLMDPDGSSVFRLTTKAKDDAVPAWSRNSLRIAFQGIDTDNDWEIYRVAATGGPLTKLTNNARTDVAPGW